MAGASFAVSHALTPTSAEPDVLRSGQQRLRRGTFRSVRQLQQAIFEHVEHHNNHAKGRQWKALPEEILARIRRARDISDKTPTG